MKTILDLPDDILRKILLLTDTHYLNQKFNLSQVCSRWRSVAHQEKLFWNKIVVRTESDCERFPTALQRSSPAALYVRLTWKYAYQERVPSDELRRNVSVRLAECKDRLHYLVVEQDRKDRSNRMTGTLLAESACYPRLETLYINGLDWGPHEVTLQLETPQLKSLSLYRERCDDWSVLLSPRMEYLKLYDCANAHTALLPLISSRCPRLETLILLRPPFKSILKASFANLLEQMPNLKTVALAATERELALILREGFKGRPLKSLSTVQYHGTISEYTKKVMFGHFYGMDPLFNLRFVDDRDIIVTDEAGRFRNLQCWDAKTSWDLPAFWTQLADVHHAQNSVQIVDVSSYWNPVAAAFALRPPLRKEFEMYVDISTDLVIDSGDFKDYDPPVSEEEKAAPGLRYMHCPKLGVIHFITDIEPLSTTSKERVDLIKTLLRAIKCDGEKVGICLAKAQLALDGTHFAETLIRELLEVDTRWVLCDSCMSCGPSPMANDGNLHQYRDLRE